MAENTASEDTDYNENEVKNGPPSKRSRRFV